MAETVTHKKQVLKKVVIIAGDEVDVIVHDEMETRLRTAEQRVGQLQHIGCTRTEKSAIR